jgi:hypothetical protein
MGEPVAYMVKVSGQPWKIVVREDVANEVLSKALEVDSGASVEPLYSEAQLRESVVQERARCAAVARGCTDYLGGYASDPALLSAYHHGMDTVARALAGPADSLQVRVLENIGRSEVSDG